MLALDMLYAVIGGIGTSSSVCIDVASVGSLMDVSMISHISWIKTSSDLLVQFLHRLLCHVLVV